MKRKIYILLSSAKQGLFALALTVFSGTAYAQASYTFNYTGGIQTLTVPVGNWGIECWGANGGSITSLGGGGTGGYSKGEFSVVTPATQLNILVGGKGFPATGNTSSAGAGGWNGGGGGAAVGRSGAGGGGATDVRVGGLAAANRIIVAGGGGGAAYYGSSLIQSSVAAGGNGGGQIAQNGDMINSAGAITPGGGGAGANGASPGLATVGTANGTASGGGGGGSSAGASIGQPGVGGSYGGAAGSPGSGATGSAGGGGGGYAGGAGGVQTSNGGLAGGGGSGYIGGVTSATMIMSGQPSFTTNPDLTGNGMVIIRELCRIVLGTNTGNNMLCQGSAITLTTDAIGNYTWSTGSNASNITVSPATTTAYTLTAMSPSNCMTSAVITVSVSSGVPVLTLTASSPSVCLGNTVSISAAGALTYTFSGGISNGVPFAPSATTAYTIQGQNGCGITTSITTINIAPLPVVASTATNVVCSGQSTTLSATGATNYSWQPTGATGATVTVSPSANTIYTVTGNTGNCTGINTVAISTNPIPTITTAGTHTSICQGESATLTASGALSYTWQPGGQTSSQIVVSPTSPTGYVVTGINSFGCTSIAQQALPVFSSPTVNLSTNTPTICSGGSATITATGANSYSWSTGAVSSSISLSPASTTVISVTGTSSATQCTDTKTITLNVFVPNVLISPNTAICVGGTATLTASGAQNYQWSTGGSGPIISVNPTSTSMYTVTGTTPIGSQNCAGTNTTQVTVNPLPTVTAVATRSNICKNENTQLTAGGANTYSWNTGATTTVITVNPLTNTSYSVQGTSTFGCKNSVFVLVRVFTCPGFVENNLEDSRLQVYPNPSKGMVNIQTYEAMELLLVNQLGQVVQTITTQEQHQYSVQLKDLSAGVYFLQAKDPQLKLNKKLIVQE